MLPSESLHIRLLGGFEVSLPSDVRVDIPTKKAQGLLAYLALHAGESQPREKLVGLFWGDSEERRAQHNLRQALTYLRKSLEPLESSPLSTNRSTVRLELDSARIDVLQFLSLATSNVPADWLAAIEIYKGDLLDGLVIKEPEFQSWLEAERAHLHEVFCQVLLSLAESKRQSGDLKGAVRLAQRLLTQDPLQERVHRMLMALYGEMGVREAALRQYERCRALLAEELGVEPEYDTKALYESLRGNGQGQDRAPDPNEDQFEIFAQESTSDQPTATPVINPWNHWTRVGLILGAVFVAGLLLWIRPWETDFEPASLDRMAFPLPDQPSIAVLPFDNLSNDQEQDYFADGITDDLITDLSKIPGLFVIARNSTFVYKGKDVPIRRVAEDLGIRYVLEGSVRRAGEQVRINAQLIDATSGGHLWAERYDGPVADVLAFQDQVTHQVASALEIKLTKAYDREIARQETINPEAYDAVLRAVEHSRNHTREDFAIAIPYLEKAIRLDPHYARAHTVLGGILWTIANEDWERSFDLTHGGALEKARHHLQLGMKIPSSQGHLFQSRMHSNEGRYEEAIVEAKKLLALNPSDARGYEALGRALNKAGLAAESIVPLRKAIRLDPRGDDKGWISYRLGESLYLSGDYQKAAEAFANSVEKNHNEWTYLFLAASLAQVGELEKAGAALAKFEQIRASAGEAPYTVARVEDWAYKNPEDRERVKEGMRKAGMPEGANAKTDFGFAQDVTPSDVAGATTISAEQAMHLFKRGVTMIDVRDQADWDEGHIPGSVHLYLYSDFTDAALSALIAKDEEVVLFAEETGGSKTSAIATARAVNWGFEKIYYFREGFPGWKAAGFPTKLAKE